MPARPIRLPSLGFVKPRGGLIADQEPKDGFLEAERAEASVRVPDQKATDAHTPTPRLDVQSEELSDPVRFVAGSPDGREAPETAIADGDHRLRQARVGRAECVASRPLLGTHRVEIAVRHQAPVGDLPCGDVDGCDRGSVVCARVANGQRVGHWRRSASSRASVTTPSRIAART